jgi:hypothetical protein
MNCSMFGEPVAALALTSIARVYILDTTVDLVDEIKLLRSKVILQVHIKNIVVSAGYYPRV